MRGMDDYLAPGTGLTKEERLQSIFEKYCDTLKAKNLRWYFAVGSRWDKRKIEKFLKYFCIPKKLEDVVAFLDTTVFKTSKEGLLFTKEGIIVKEPLNKLYYLEYSKLQEAEVVEEYNDAGYLTDSKLIVHFRDGNERIVFDYYIRKHFFVDYINEVVLFLSGFEPKPV